MFRLANLQTIQRLTGLLILSIIVLLASVTYTSYLFGTGIPQEQLSALITLPKICQESSNLIDFNEAAKEYDGTIAFSFPHKKPPFFKVIPPTISFSCTVPITEQRFNSSVSGYVVVDLSLLVTAFLTALSAFFSIFLGTLFARLISKQAIKQNVFKMVILHNVYHENVATLNELQEIVKELLVRFPKAKAIREINIHKETLKSVNEDLRLINEAFSQEEDMKESIKQIMKKELVELDLVDQLNEFFNHYDKNKKKGFLNLRILVEGSAHSNISQGRFYTILGNLIRNSRNAEAKGVTITLNNSNCDSFWEIEVADDGHGLDTKEYNRYSQIGMSGTRSTGLGLPISKLFITEIFGGKFEFDAKNSEKGKGATFIISLPKSQAAK